METWYLIVDERAFGNPEEGSEFEAVVGWENMLKSCVSWPGQAVVRLDGEGRRHLVGSTNLLPTKANRCV